MAVKDLQDEIIALENELKDLKTIQEVLPNMTAYTKSYTHTGTGQSGQVNQIIEVEYADGTGPIFSGCTNQDYGGVLEISSNKQRFFFRILFTNTKLTFYSNREIVAVRNIT